MADKDLLIVDDDPLICESLKEMLLLEDYTVDAVRDGQAALAKLQRDRYQLVLSDIQMPGLNGVELLKELKGRAPDTIVIIITGHGYIEGAVEAIKLGAYDYITKPIDDIHLKLTIAHALEQKKLLASYNSLKQRLKPSGPGRGPGVSRASEDGSIAGAGPCHRRYHGHGAGHR